MTRIDNPWLLLATLPLYHPVQDLKMTPLLQFTPVHFLKSTPLPLLTPVCNFEALLGASLIQMDQQAKTEIYLYCDLNSCDTSLQSFHQQKTDSCKTSG